jgi:hypothetical protein
MSKKIAEAFKAGDKKTVRAEVAKMNEKTTRIREQYKAGTWW